MLFPTQTFTFLFTDIEGSTRLWEAHPEVMRHALERHDALLHDAIKRHNGHVFKTVGDAFCATFEQVGDAVRAAEEAQQALCNEPWPSPAPLRVRIALHAGPAEERDGDYFGSTLNRVARILAAAHGGQTLISQVVRDHVPLGTPLKDLGEHRLKDLSSPERLYQLLLPNHPDSFPPLRSLSTHPNNLPQQMTSFIGRESELAQVATMLESSRLVTLTGAGGSGKTRLCLQTAAEVLERFPDGIFVVELAALTDPNQVPQTVADALGLQQEDLSRPSIVRLTEFLRTRQLLLLLDNCEHLLDACARLADTLLRACPALRLLTTSREALGIPGEVTYRIPSLTDNEATRLFLDRARQVQTSFVLTAENAPAITAICTRLDGIPLALELAAARVRALSVEEIDRKLDQRFRLLTGGSRTALPRQQTLRSLIDWSYALLSAAEKQVLESLSVFVGGWTLEAAEAVCADELTEDWEMLDRVTSLVDKSLVLAETKPGHTRFRMLETIRQYARDRLLDRGDGEEVRERHQSYFLALAEREAPRLVNASQADALRRLEEERENLRACYEWSLQNPQTDHALRLCIALGEWWTATRPAEGLEWCRNALAAANADAHSLMYARTLRCAAVMAMAVGDPDSPRYCETFIAAYQALGERAERGELLAALAVQAMFRGERELAITHREATIAHYRALGDEVSLSRQLSTIADQYQRVGNLEAAQRCRLEALTLLEKRGDKRALGSHLRLQGIQFLNQLRFDEARTALSRSLALSAETGSRVGIVHTLISIGQLNWFTGDLPAAKESFAQLSTESKTSGIVLTEAVSYFGSALIACDEGDLVTAEGFMEQCFDVQGGKAGLLGSLLINPLPFSFLFGHCALATCRGEDTRAAMLHGAAIATWDAFQLEWTPFNRGSVARYEAPLRVRLGDAAFEAASESGRRLSLEEAIDVALNID